MDRRQFIRLAGSGTTGLIVYGGLRLSPAEAAARNVPLRVFSAAEAGAFAALAEALVPGAQAAGIVHFLDYQLSVPPTECLLIAKYFNVKPPYLGFYREGMRSLNAYCATTYDASVDRLTAVQLRDIAASIGAGNPSGWAGPPAPLWYLLLRSDAVDLVYGTPDGLARLDLPYMAHIDPPMAWS